jgi:thiol:disulfide interchange protein DsbD
LAFLLFLLLGSAREAYAVDAADLLPPERAFRASLIRPTATTVAVAWDIAPGYYLYRQKFRFASRTPGIEVGTPNFPRGQIHRDKFFGE